MRAHDGLNLHLLHVKINHADQEVDHIVGNANLEQAFPVMGAGAVTARRGKSPVILIDRRITAAG